MKPTFFTLPALALLLAGCFETTDCTLIGCADQLTVHLLGPADSSEVSGMITVGGHAFVVDCEGTSDPEVLCTGDAITIQLAEGQGGGAVQWSLSSDGRDSGGGGGGYAGDGTVTPDWEVSQPNGPDCGPTCTSAEMTVELLGTP